ncbi:hypothetical protein PSHT_13282 [Puccinia striiformis]|uniref:Deacetylase sirtuin-type domain-containing protein n=1 Tax=Puccinia striiformis TaxID=27350 RepID=A0A2S4URV9_9BASI|nr:hypothetical protein PSHT_13282 [Puccinia striiformis]
MCPTTQLVVLPGTRQTALGPIPSFVKPVSDTPEPDLQRAIKAVLNAKRVAVVVGAGISTSANIPDFRSSTGLFASLKARFPNAKLTSGRDLFDVNAWKDPDTLSLHFGMLAELHKMCGAAQPTAFHQFLKRLDDDGKLSRVYTQNIDGLEEKAGLTYGIPSQDEIQSHSSSANRSRPTPPLTPSKQNLKRKRDQSSSDQHLPPTPRSTPPPSQNTDPEPSHSQSELDETCSSSQLSTVSTITCKPNPTQALSQSKPKTRAASAAEAAEAPAPPRPTRAKPIDPFPRVIPLHGTLKNLSCLTCKHSVLMSDYIGELAEGSQSYVHNSGVVLYGEEHNAGDQVGAVTSRDLLRGRRPDLLIVAGTSLKVPGTKRLVKELSKVIKPLSKSSSSVSGEEEEEEENPKKPTPITRSSSTMNSPLHETFDVWIKGNVDQFIRLVDEERKAQEELKEKKAQEKLERERKKEEKIRRSSGTSLCPSTLSSAPPIVTELSAPITSRSRASTTANTAKSKKLTAKADPKTTVTKSVAAKPSVAGFFTTSKATVVSQPTAKITNSKNPTKIKISNKKITPTSVITTAPDTKSTTVKKTSTTAKAPSTRKKVNNNNSTQRSARSKTAKYLVFPDSYLIHLTLI